VYLLLLVDGRLLMLLLLIEKSARVGSDLGRLRDSTIGS
jgi:hypothetical protein